MAGVVDAATPSPEGNRQPNREDPAGDWPRFRGRTATARVSFDDSGPTAGELARVEPPWRRIDRFKSPESSGFGYTFGGTGYILRPEWHFTDPKAAP